ncbi:uncharacterized protein CLAFUR5_14620 [Fulvia fulva]|uniref:Uncharacterized protein n=1 Tax=Passalora fulva TaxID=5499 RepID=A0A9Q8PMV9_PASFU|nr:uncharacterized protein CLAFUR5_14620 [Fulvia fulva]UJO25327.1 hypothetical protein CLAFUR5_14620 [Fulvia fulva]
MRQYFDLCKTGAITQLPPAGYEPKPHVYPATTLRHPEWLWRDWFEVNVLRLPVESHSDSSATTKYLGDSDMLVFSNAITKVREKAYEALSSRFNITILEDRPYAMIAWPSFFFTIIAQCDALMEPIPAWQRLDNSYKSLNIATVPSDKPQSWAAEVQKITDGVLQRTWSSSDKTYSVPVILTGSAWHETAVEELRRAPEYSSQDLSVAQLPQPAYASSMGAAAMARISEPVFSNNFAASIPETAREVEFTAAIEYWYHEEL